MQSQARRRWLTQKAVIVNISTELMIIPYSGKIWPALNLTKQSLEVIGDF